MNNNDYSRSRKDSYHFEENNSYRLYDDTVIRNYSLRNNHFQNNYLDKKKCYLNNKNTDFSPQSFLNLEERIGNMQRKCWPEDIAVFRSPVDGRFSSQHKDSRIFSKFHFENNQYTQDTRNLESPFSNKTLLSSHKEEEKQLSHNRPQTLNLDCAKASLWSDSKSIQISNINRLAIAQQRELSREPKSKFETDCGIYHSSSEVRNDFNKRKREESITEQNNSEQTKLILFNRRMTTAAKMGRVDLCWKILKEIWQVMVPDTYSYNPILDLFVKQKNEKEALALFEKMKIKGIKPDIVTYNILMNHHGNKEDERGALALLKEMKTKGIKPDIVTFGILMNLYVNKEDEKEALNLLKKMKTKGIKPNVTTYTSLINLYVKKENIEEALELLKEMKIEGIKLNIKTYTSLINVYVKKGYENEALAILKEMKKEGIKPDIVTYTSLINVHVKNENVKEALARLKEMKKEGIKPEIVTYNLLIDLFVKHEKLNLAKSLFNSQFSIDKFLNEEGLNVHGLSQGAAFIALTIFIESHWKSDSFILVTGKGLRCNQNPYAMRNFLEGKIKEKFDYLDWQIEENKGRIKVFFPETNTKSPNFLNDEMGIIPELL